MNDAEKIKFLKENSLFLNSVLVKDRDLFERICEAFYSAHGLHSSEVYWLSVLCERYTNDDLPVLKE